MDYAKVIADFASGEIDKNDWMMIFDNDCGYWAYVGEPAGDEEESAAEEAMSKKYGVPAGYQDLVDLANDAGIPSQWC